MSRKVLFFIFILTILPFSLSAQESVLPVEINGDQINYLQEEGTMLAKGNVRITYKDVKLFCDEATYDSKGHVAVIKGNVKIVREGTTVYGENIVYDFNTLNATMVNVSIESPPLYGKAKEIGKEGEGQYVLNKGYFTTCSLKQPHYYLSARKITIYPQKEVIARDVFFKVGSVPILYVPYFAQSLQDSSFPLQVIPGKEKDWGYYALSRWGYAVNPNQKGKVLADWYEERGFGKGVTHTMQNEKYGNALINLYSIEDELYKRENREDLFDKLPEVRNVPQGALEDDRYKAQISYSVQATRNLAIRAELNKFSDEFFMKDFFYDEYEVDQRPVSYLLFDYGFSNSSLSLLGQKRVNEFNTETEYLPSLEYDFYRQSLGGSDLYLESRSSIASLSRSFAYTPDSYYDALRVHNHNVLSYPKSVHWLYLNPYIGTYSTLYSRDLLEQHTDVARFAPEVGMDIGTKIYKTFDVDFSMWGNPVKQMRHVFTPTIGYSYIMPPTVSRYDLLQFDSIDMLEQDEKVIVTLGNKLQARNAERTWDFVYFAPAVEYRLYKSSEGSFVDKIRCFFEVYPKEGVSLTTRSTYDYRNHALSELNLDLGLTDVKNNKYAVAFGARYAKDENTQGTIDWMYQLTPKLQFKNYLRYDYKAGHLEEQRYALRSDLHCWWMDTGVDVSREKDLTFWVKFILKDFPDVHVGFDQTYHGAKKEY